MQSEKSKNKPRKASKKFSIFVKPIDSEGMIIERKCGWISYINNKICLSIFKKNAIVFEEKPNKHGSYQDWVKFFKEEHPKWTFPDNPTYID